MNSVDENRKPMYSSKKMRRVFKHTHEQRAAHRSLQEPGDSRSSSPKKKTGRLSRRDFFKVGISALGAVVMAEVGLVGFMYFRSRSQEGRSGGKITAGPISSFPPGSITEFSQEGFFLVSSKEGALKALYRRCPHLGCNVEWLHEKEQFYCPCHGSSFDANGKLERPPVPRPLDVFPITIQKEMVIVDTTRAFGHDEVN